MVLYEGQRAGDMFCGPAAPPTFALQSFKNGFQLLATCEQLLVAHDRVSESHYDFPLCRRTVSFTSFCENEKTGS